MSPRLVCMTTPSAISLLEEPAAAAFDGLDADESAFAGEDDWADSPLSCLNNFLSLSMVRSY